MNGIRFNFGRPSFNMAMLAIAALGLGGCGNDGPAVLAAPQSISYPTPSAPAVDQSAVTVSASASSGLPVKYSSMTPTVCTVDGNGVVTGMASGICTIAADQAGDPRHAPAPQVTRDIVFAFSHSVTFTPPPALLLYDKATVSASDSAGLPVSYASATPATCSVDGGTGLVTAVATGTCSVSATAGTVQSIQTFSVSPPTAATLPGIPSGVTATSGDSPNKVLVHIGATSSGGSLISGYTVTSIPTGITVTGESSPVTVSCPASCSGYAFTAAAVNGIGTGAPSSPAEVITTYSVLETFFEPDTQPRNSIFSGTFTLNSTTGTVTNLRGKLSESMTGDLVNYPAYDFGMTWLQLDHQLSSTPVTLGGIDGLLVTTFRLPSTDTLWTGGGGDGWSPGTGFGLYFGFPSQGANPGNAYAMVFINPNNPTAPLTQAQIDKLAYADCTPGGMMGAACMTGTTKAGYGTVGTMSGYPVSQTITK